MSRDIVLAVVDLRRVVNVGTQNITRNARNGLNLPASTHWDAVPRTYSLRRNAKLQRQLAHAARRREGGLDAGFGSLGTAKCCVVCHGHACAIMVHLCQDAVVERIL